MTCKLNKIKFIQSKSSIVCYNSDESIAYSASVNYNIDPGNPSTQDTNHVYLSDPALNPPVRYFYGGSIVPLAFFVLSLIFCIMIFSKSCLLSSESSRSRR